MNHTQFTERLHRFFSHVPAWIFSIICLLAILYLTLMPDPFGDQELPLSPGADKLVHELMFFGLTLCMLFDTLRSHGWKGLSLPVISLLSLVGMATGIGIEYLQEGMHLGRGLEYWDMAADAFGAIAAGALWTLMESFLTLTDEEREKRAEEREVRKE